MNILRCEFIGEAMRVKNFLFLFLLLIPSIIFGQDINIQSLKSMNNEDLKTYLNQAQKQGYSLDQIKTMAKAQGISDFEIAEFERRVTDLGLNELTNKTFESEDISTSMFGLIENTEPDEVISPSEIIFGSSFFKNPNISSVPSLNVETNESYEIAQLYELDISIFGAEKNEYTSQITRDVYLKIEIDRVVPTLKDCKKYFPEIFFSIDTFRSKVAEECIHNGADIINDISGGNLDTNMMKVVGKYQIPYIIMHMKGNPSNMVEKAKYDDIIGELINYFSKKIDEAANLNIKDIIIDPGFGFAKNISQNFELLKNLDFFKNLEKPMLVGLSRKSMIYKTLNIKADKALNGSTALHTISLIKGANILRVHDVKAVSYTHLTLPTKA